jgi:hypothetical protein
VYGPRKQFAVFETGSVEDPKTPGRKGQWLLNALASIKNDFPRLKALIYSDFDTSATGARTGGWTPRPPRSTRSRILARDPHFNTRQRTRLPALQPVTTKPRRVDPSQRWLPIRGKLASRPMSEARWPNLFIVGAAKAGTTSLHDYLDQHPEVFMSPVKEPHFFSGIEPAPELAAFFPSIRDEAAYLNLFTGASDEKVLGEASTSYLAYPKTAAAIKRVNSDARIVIMLRDPVERAHSHYWNDVREGFEHRSFLDAVSDEIENGNRGWGVSSMYVDCGLYADRVETYLAAFGQNALVLFFEEFVANTRLELERTLAFLEVDAAVSDRIDLEIQNPFALPRNAMSARLMGSGRARRLARSVVPGVVRGRAREVLLKRTAKPAMEPEVRQLLADVYRPDRERLPELLGRRLPWPER